MDDAVDQSGSQSTHSSRKIATVGDSVACTLEETAFRAVVETVIMLLHAQIRHVSVSI